MERLAGQDEELYVDEEDGTVAVIEAGRPLRWRVNAGLVTAAAAIGLASLALATAPWHRGAATVGTELFHSLNSRPFPRGTVLTQIITKCDTEIYVKNTQIFEVGDDIVIGEVGNNESAVVASVEDEEGKVTLQGAVSKGFPISQGHVSVPAAGDPVSKPAHDSPECDTPAPTPAPTPATPVAPTASTASVDSADTSEPGGGSGWMGMIVLLLFLLCCLAGCCLAGGKYFGFNKYFGRATTGAQEKASQWMFKPVDDQAVIALESPSFESPETGEVVHPGELIKVTEKQPPTTVERFANSGGGVEMQEDDLGEGDGLFLKLSDGRGWILDREPGNDMCFELFTSVDQVWKYDPKSGGHMPILVTPNIEGATTGARLRLGEKFKVSEIQAFSDNGILFLKLADGRGWVYDQYGQERLCKRIVEEMWAYQPANGAPMAIRRFPEMDGERTHDKVYPEETFEVDEVVIGDRDHNLLFLKLSDGRGWLFNKHPQVGGLCNRVY